MTKTHDQETQENEAILGRRTWEDKVIFFVFFTYF